MRSFRVALGLATLVMLGLSWPLWIEPSVLPRVPFLPGLGMLPPWGSWVIFVLLVGSILLGTLGIRPRWTLGLAALFCLVLVLADQHRFQPWIYQFLVAALALCLTTDRRALSLLRWYSIALYGHSGLSKLDVSFARELGPRFLGTLLHPFGLDPEVWPTSVQHLAVWFMPLFEVALAVGLALPATRRWAVAGVMVLHLSLIGILGPWGLDQSTIVLCWNAALLVENLILFLPQRDLPLLWLRPCETWLTPMVLLGYTLVVVGPLGERVGGWETWPSFAYYASHAERIEILIHEDEVPHLDETAQRSLFPVGPGPWRRLDLTAWSRATRGVPVYPQNRAGLGLVIGLCDRDPVVQLVRVRLWGRASLIQGRRDFEDLWGPDEIRHGAERFRWNARPAQPQPLAPPMTDHDGRPST